VERFDGLTIQLGVADIRAGVEFYAALLGRPPDYEPHEDFKEWEVFPGCWLQIAQGRPVPTYPVRLRCADVETERERVERELGVRCSPVSRLPGVVALCNFHDPWGNRLGLYQRLFTDQPAIPGGSYRDEGRGGGVLDPP
jgi:predicted enzyme related to lactoylglutathione lyase